MQAGLGAWELGVGRGCAVDESGPKSSSDGDRDGGEGTRGRGDEEEGAFWIGG